MSKVLRLAAIAEALTGLGLLFLPSLVGELLVGERLTGVSVPVARVAGLALTCLAIACSPWPPILGMLCYSTLAALYLGYLGVSGDFSGVLLWPAVALHLVLSLLLGAEWRRRNKTAALP